MIKSGQIEALQVVCIHYITFFTKAQTETLLTNNIIQKNQFDNTLVEVHEHNIQYIPGRAFIGERETANSRPNKLRSIENLVKK